MRRMTLESLGREAVIRPEHVSLNKSSIVLVRRNCAVYAMMLAAGPGECAPLNRLWIAVAATAACPIAMTI